MRPAFFVDAYVRQVRALGRWRSLAEHPRISELYRAWADDVAGASGSSRWRNFGPSSLSRGPAMTKIVPGKQRAALASLALRLILNSGSFRNPGDESLRGALASCAVDQSAGRACAVLRAIGRHTCIVCASAGGHTRGAAPHFEQDAGAADTVSLGDASECGGRDIAGPVRERQSRIGCEPSGPVPAGPSGRNGDALRTRRNRADDVASGGIPSAAIRRWLVETRTINSQRPPPRAAIRIQDDALVWLAP